MDWKAIPSVKIRAQNADIRLMLAAVFVAVAFLVAAPPVSASCSSACGNETGNGDEIISGPDGSQGSDYGQVFRSLTVHPTDPNTVIMGTERNGFVKSTDRGDVLDGFI